MGEIYNRAYMDVFTARQRGQSGLSRPLTNLAALAPDNWR